MASGSRKKYALDLDDKIAFPDAGHMPAFPPAEGESWILLMEIKEDRSIVRPVYLVRDITGTPWIVALYTDDPAKDTKNFSIGHTLCIKSALPYQFLDGQIGFRIEDSDIIEVLPVSLAKLWGINRSLRERNDEGNLLNCNVCNATCKAGCSVCKNRYCSTECQRSDWKHHKTECIAKRALHRWNRTDFG